MRRVFGQWDGPEGSIERPKRSARLCEVRVNGFIAARQRRTERAIARGGRRIAAALQVEAHRDLDRLLMRGVDGEATSGGFQGQTHVARAVGGVNRSRERH